MGSRPFSSISAEVHSHLVYKLEGNLRTIFRRFSKQYKSEKSANASTLCYTLRVFEQFYKSLGVIIFNSWAL